jgi:hypothetical protein
MATVKLAFDEAKQGHLPHTCIWCGEAAFQFKSKRLRPSNQVALRAPFCVRHRHHWRIRTTLVYVLLAATALAWAITPVIAVECAQRPKTEATILIVLSLAVAELLFPLLFVASVILFRFHGVRVKRTQDGVLVWNVADEFVEALRVHRNKLGNETS